MLVYGVISPHPPIIIPSVGKEQLPKVANTIAALEQVALRLGQAQPTELIIISPHEGHGFEVPLYYLATHLPPATKGQQILVTHDSYLYYYDYGRQVGERLAREDTRYAVIASADLSHVLLPDGPYGYDPAGPLLDEQIVKGVRERDAQALLSIDPVLLVHGAECGLRSILFLLGALEGIDVLAHVVSYEGPFGVGYLTADFDGQPVA
jgi:aromatic ring-opening dioxygenase LigB subunit